MRSLDATGSGGGAIGDEGAARVRSLDTTGSGGGGGGGNDATSRKRKATGSAVGTARYMPYS